MNLELKNGRWYFGNKRYHELNIVEQRMFSILLKVELIISKIK